MAHAIWCNKGLRMESVPSCAAAARAASPPLPHSPSATSFKAGSSHYGISDLEFWDQETHKFEAHYCRTLIGPYPEQTALYRERSPIHRAGEINVPLLIFQGLDDKVVPPNQSRFVADALRARGVPVAHVEFEGEAHGFRFFETNVRVHQTELAFFGQVFGFDPADELPPAAHRQPGRPFSQWERVTGLR